LAVMLHGGKSYSMMYWKTSALYNGSSNKEQTTKEQYTITKTQES